MKEICHLASSHARYDRRVFLKECLSLAKEGYNVSLIVADGNGFEVTDNISIYDVGKENSRLKRLFLTPIKMRKLTAKLNSHIFHFHDPELIFTAFKLKRKKKKVIFDMHEDYPAHIMDSKTIPLVIKSVLAYIFRKLDIRAAKKFDAIISTRESINNRIERYSSNIEMITNYPIIDEHISKKEKSNTTKISFAGAIGSNWRHHLIIEAIEKLENVKYVLAGPGDEDYLAELKKQKGWGKVDYKGFIKYDDVKSIYSETNIGIAVHTYNRNMDGRKGNLANTKLFEYMNWEIPIICSDFELWKRIIEDEEKCGICVNPNNVDEIVDAIKYLSDNPDIAKQMGENGRKAAVREYNWNTQSKKLISLYKKLV